MRRRAGGLLLVGWVGVVAAGCTPGPVRARPPDNQTGAGGGLGGRVVEVVGRDAATPVPDAPAVSDASPADLRGAGGAGGGHVLDAGRPPDARGSDAAVQEQADAAVDGARDAPVDAPHLRSPQPGEVVVDELLVNPAGDDLGREWIEIVSRAGDLLDLSGLHLATASTDVAAPAGTIAPGALLLLGQSLEPTKNGGAPVAIAYGTKLILVNGAGHLSLCVGPCASGVVIDTLSWDALPDVYLGHALVVDPSTKTYCPAAAPFGTGGNFGTPGFLNPPCAEPIDAAAPASAATDAGATDAAFRD